MLSLWLTNKRLMQNRVKHPMISTKMLHVLVLHMRSITLITNLPCAYCSSTSITAKIVYSLYLQNNSIHAINGYDLCMQRVCKIKQTTKRPYAPSSNMNDYAFKPVSHLPVYSL